MPVTANGDAARSEATGAEHGDLPERLRRLGEEPDPRRRRLIMLGLLTARLSPLGIEPILVGGAAVEF